VSEFFPVWRAQRIPDRKSEAGGNGMLTDNAVIGNAAFVNVLKTTDWDTRRRGDRTSGRSMAADWL
jgi:hypothetical protein